jgi:hypothetical protein
MDGRIFSSYPSKFIEVLVKVSAIFPACLTLSKSEQNAAFTFPGELSPSPDRRQTDAGGL